MRATIPTPPYAPFESGVAARLLGTVQAVVHGGMASLGVVTTLAARVPQLRQLKRIG